LTTSKRGQQLKIPELSFLVVEDNEFQRETLVEMLRRSKAKNIYSASDGQRALELLAVLDTGVDVIISDLEMPTMDGMEFVRHVATGGFRNSVIIASALDRTLLATVETMSRAYGINLLGVISKPVTLGSLEPLLNRHVPPGPRLKVSPQTKPSFTLDEIMHGLEQKEFEAFFQPKVELATRRVVGAEALARWRHPQHGIVYPAAFIQVLVDAGKIDDLLWVMLRRSAAFCGTLNEMGRKSSGSVALNVSLKSLSNVDLANRLAEIARGYNVEPRQMCLEITESAVTTDVGAALENLTRLRMKGFGLAIDDFGTGYSSMQQLARIPFTELKIDRSFVTSAMTHESAKVILSSSLQLAKNLKILAVAEGVETHAQWDLLAGLGCDLAQGYFIAKPMVAAAYLDWLRNLETNAMSIAVA
jgi:EAL domain-containing protein (putative c-di-GMP-specific phosphodiesterase class I)